MKNLARGIDPPTEVVEEVTAIAKSELEAAGIEVLMLPFPLRGEVPSCASGGVIMWSFTRAWTYWVAKGPGLPVEVAQRLHATHGRDVRVAGHCGCPSPREWFKGFGVGLYHVDTQDGLAALAGAIRSVVANVDQMTSADETKVRIDYTNWRGERSTRLIVPIRIDFENNEWHPVTQWILEAVDLEKGEIRSFAFQNIHSWKPIGEED